MYIHVTSCIFKSVGAFQASFGSKEKVLLLKSKTKIEHLYFYICSQSDCMDLGESVNVLAKAYPACVYGKITRNCTGEF